MQKTDLKRKLQIGFLVFGTLVVIKIIEYIVGTSLRTGSWPYLGILALVGAWPILNYFMHIKQLKRPLEDSTKREE